MKNLRSYICLVIVCMLCACSATSETPEISAFPTLRVTESANMSETVTPSATPVTPSQTPNTTGDFVPDENAPIKLSLSFMTGSGEFVKDTGMYKAAMEYMRTHPDVYIDLRTTQIVFTSDQEKYIENLMNNLAAGTAADITLLDYSFPIRQVAAEATLVNFEELIESDSEVKRADFFENILDAVKYEEGLYVMPLSFYLNSYAMNKEYTHLLDKPLEEYKALDYRDMMKVYEKAIASQTDGDMIYMNNDSRNSLSFLYALDLLSLDYDTRTVDIYNDSTRGLVEKAVNLPLVSTSEASKCNLSSFFFAPEVNTLFADVNAGYGTYLDCYMGYEDIKYTSPIPLADFNGDVHFALTESAIISQSCREIDTAWDFMKFLMGYDKNYPESDYDPSAHFQAYSVQRDMFKDMMTKIFERRYEVNLEHSRTLPYSKEDAIERAVTAFEEEASLATKRLQSNDSDFMSIWYFSHYVDYNNKATTVTEMLKALERDLVDLLAKY